MTSKKSTDGKIRNRSLPVIGWREWVKLPELGDFVIKAKIDTGARSSALHAKNIVEFKQDGSRWIKFEICPNQRHTDVVIQAEAELLDYRSVRSSSGKTSVRPVIITEVELLGEKWPIEITLTSRDEMGFRMLLGREAFRNRFLIDAGKSYYGGRKNT